MTAKTAQGTLWVCTCCLFAREGDGCEGQHDHDAEPWSLEPDTDVTLGGACEDLSHTGECECDRMDFSWSRCDGCGSPLGGERHAYTYWSAE